MKELIRLVVTDPWGDRHACRAEAGVSLMQAIRDAGLDIAAQCGGCCSCGTCHVYVDPMWLDRIPPAGADEKEILELVMALQPGSRLSCQIRIEPALEGLAVQLAPGSTF